MLVRRKLIANTVGDLLKKWKINKLPINVCAIAEKENIKIVEDEHKDESLSGFIFIDNEKKIIGINSKNSKKNKERKRFTVAHELGHYFLHTFGNSKTYVDTRESVGIRFRDHESSKGTNIEEVEANLFAAELLMPLNFLQQEIDKAKPLSCVEELIEKMASKFEVSQQAMTIRLSSIGLINLG